MPRKDDIALAVARALDALVIQHPDIPFIVIARIPDPTPNDPRSGRIVISANVSKVGDRLQDIATDLANRDSITEFEERWGGPGKLS